MCLVEPGAFREMHSFAQKSCDGNGRLEVISLAATEDTPSVHAAPAHDSLAGVPGRTRAVPEPSQQAMPAVSSPARLASSLHTLPCHPSYREHPGLLTPIGGQEGVSILADALAFRDESGLYICFSTRCHDPYVLGILMCQK